MADYYLIGNLENDDDLYLVDTSARSVCPIPREVWEEVVEMFQSGEDARSPTAADLLDEIEAARAAGRPARIALSANGLGELLVTVRIEAVERAMERSPALDAALRPHLVHHRAAA